MRIVCVSDTHNQLGKMRNIPDGDVLVHAGDMTNRGTFNEIARFGAELRALPHKHKVVIAGNHDFFFEKNQRPMHLIEGPGIHYLQDSGVEIDGIRFWGSPYQPWFYDWAFNLPRNGEELRQKWNLIPVHTDVLITHGPPHGVLDRVPRPPPQGEELVGCEKLALRLRVLKTRLHVFGHIHCGYGTKQAPATINYATPARLYVNASICNESYKPVNPPIIVEISAGSARATLEVPDPA